ncbi:hypothetical protein MBOU_58200 [Mycobacterium bourgelatii]|uniref:Uncharacterized protein n=1 Tax=Mycobacterium bourgelatii TaxID=1273442 RepID=A0A7I9YYU2_MYCBU|nr:hypothetical protein MBOU_58200 [Mycobacterium bourgelatii]
MTIRPPDVRKQRQEPLDNRKGPNKVCFQLQPQNLRRNAFQGRAYCNARVVHQCPEPGVATRSFHHGAGSVDRRRFGNVEQQGDDLADQRIRNWHLGKLGGAGFATHAGENPKAEAAEV